MKTNRGLLAFAMVAAANTAFGQLAITQQPTNQSVSLGANVTFQCRASGTGVLSYQWFFDESGILNSTNRSLVLTNVQLANAGNYSMVVTNSSGSATSQLAHLDVDPTFTKITSGSIVTEIGTGAGCAWGDYDNDGFLDLIVTSAFNPVDNTDQKNLLFHNNGNGTFTKITTGAVVSESRDWRGCAWADYDNDGRLDLFVTSTDADGFAAQNELFRNNGDDTFTKMTPASVGAIVPGGGGSEGCVWGDYDNDGFIDLYVARYGPDWLFHNNGDGTFSQMTNSIPNDSQDTYPAMWGDYDNDGFLDLFTGNNLQHLPGTNSLYHNNRDGTFTKITAGNIATDRKFVLDCSWADYDNDGNLDLFAVNAGGPNSLYHNNGDGTFTTMTSNIVGTITSDLASFVRCSWGDYDNDGFLDLYVTQDRGGNFLYHNNRDGTFSRVLTGSLVNDQGVGSACAWGDYDNDGFLDLFVACGADVTPERNRLYHNNGNGNAWIKIKLVGTVSNRSAVGAKVRVKATIWGQTLWQMREVNTGSGFNANQLDAHFGLGDATNIDVVRVEWPSGIVQSFTNVPPRQTPTITEHQGNVTGPLAFTGVERLTNGAVHLSLSGSPGLRYLLEASTNLVSWIKIGVRTNLNGAVEFLDSSAKQFNRRFYRASAP